MNTPHYGQQLVLKHGLNKPTVAYVASKSQGDYLVKLCVTWLYIPGVTQSFFVHINKLDTYYDYPNIGKQAALFAPAPSIYDRLKHRHLMKTFTNITGDSKDHQGTTDIYLFSNDSTYFKVITRRKSGDILEISTDGYSEYTDIREMVAHLRLRGFEVEKV